MKKGIIDKITTPDMPLSADDLTADEKKRLYAAMEEQGATAAFAWARFFRDGFATWEILGIRRLQIDYLQYLHCEEKVQIEVRGDMADPTDGTNQPSAISPQTSAIAYRHYYQMADGEERSFSLLTAGDFWRFLGDVKRRQAFSDWMRQRGMRSAVTVSKRFSADDWRGYELLGIEQIVRDFVEREQHQEQTTD